MYDLIRRNKKRMIIYALSDNRYSYNTAILSQKKKSNSSSTKNKFRQSIKSFRLNYWSMKE